MKISVAMATYNGENYIQEQLQSILDQTRRIDEVVIVDDASSDQTVHIVEDFIKQHDLKHWVCIVNEHNLGYIENFRKAIQWVIQNGEEDAEQHFVFLADQDDVWVKDRVARMAEEMEKHPEIGLLNTRPHMFRDGEEPWREAHSESDTGELKRIDLTPYTRFLRSLGCEMVFRKSFYEDVQQHWYEGWAHDEFLWCIATLYGVSYDFNYVSLYRRIHEKQVSGRFGHEKQKRIEYLQGVEQSSAYLLQVSQKKGMSKRICKLFQKNVDTHHMRLELIRDKKLRNALFLIPCLRYYYAPKSYFVELAIALKGNV